MLGDVELVKKTADTLAEKIKNLDFDYIVGPEVSVVPLISELSQRLGKDRYVVCRKSIKPYMVNPLVLKPLDYFPKHIKPLVIDGPDRELIAGKKVIIIDDIVSTGVTIRMINKLMELAQAKVVANVAILVQGDNQFDQIENFISLGKLPIFKQS